MGTGGVVAAMVSLDPTANGAKKVENTASPNKPVELTDCQVAHLDTVQSLSDADRRAMDEIAEDIAKVQPPTIDAAAQEAATVNASATRAVAQTPRQRAIEYARGVLGRTPTAAEVLQAEHELWEMELVRPRRRLVDIAVAETKESDKFAGNRLDTIGHDEPPVKGGQGRNGLEVGDAAAWFFVLLAGVIVIGVAAWYCWGVES